MDRLVLSINGVKPSGRKLVFIEYIKEDKTINIILDHPPAPMQGITIGREDLIELKNWIEKVLKL